MKVPNATYRLQLTPQFGFSRVREVLNYLVELGVSDIYASPVLKPVSGSTHGYDVIDPTAVNPELGGEEDFRHLLKETKALGLGWIQDIVPNHMAFDSQNRMLMDILEHGTASPYVGFFDIDWNHPYDTLKKKLLVPFLGSFYGECLERGEIQLTFQKEGFAVRYYELRLPLRIESYGTVLGTNLTELKEHLGKDHPDVLKYQGILHTFRNLPSPDHREERLGQITFAKQMLWELYSSNQGIRAFVDELLLLFNGQPGRPESFNRLDALLSEQHFRLALWKVASEEINYRRFFTINHLISVRVEDPEVFQETHKLILSLAGDGLLTGLRIDHIDGLLDPAGYLNAVRQAVPQAYVVVEKILQPDEPLPRWPIQGTTGYDFLNAVNGLFCEKKSDKRFDTIYSRITGRYLPAEVLFADTKRLIIGRHMAGDIDRLAHLLKNLSSTDRYARDITLYGLRRALVEILTFFPVYRTYAAGADMREDDRRFIREAVRKSRETNPALTLELNFIERFLLLRTDESTSQDEFDQMIHFVMRFQQMTGPLMAKGFEDTALYRYNKLISLNEVGGAPRRFGLSHLEFHQFNRNRNNHWPHTMNATATHDTKRGEDFRVRLDVISEMPDEWNRAVGAWIRLNRDKKVAIDGVVSPDANDEYFLYQTMVGSFPFDVATLQPYRERLKAYVIKAVREAKVHTAWLKPDDHYERGFLDFIDRILENRGKNSFLSEFLEFQKDVTRVGVFNSLSQVLLKATVPGVPDIYQGTELWDFSFVDPDNRMPVDFELRTRYLSEIRDREKKDIARLIREIIAGFDDGRLKLFTIYRSLRARKIAAGLFREGEYIPLKVTGKHRNHVIAFARRHKGDLAIVVAPRRYGRLISPHLIPIGEKVWEDTSVVLPDATHFRLQNAYTDQVVEIESTLPLSVACKKFPVGLFTPPLS